MRGHDQRAARDRRHDLRLLRRPAGVPGRPAGVPGRSVGVPDRSAGNPGAAVARDPSVPGVSPSSPAPGSSARGRFTAFPPRLLVCLVLAVPVVALAMVPALQFRGWTWASLVLASPVVLWGAWPLYRAAIANARHGAATMDTLVSLGVAAAYLWSLYALIVGHGSTYLDVATGVTALVLLGRHLEARARRQSGAALRALLDPGAKAGAVLRDGREVRTPVSVLAVGDEFVVRPGEQIATDGVVRSGHSAVDASMLTGEPVPAEVTVGDPGTGGCVSTSGRLVVRATRVGADTQPAHMARPG